MLAGLARKTGPAGWQAPWFAGCSQLLLDRRVVRVEVAVEATLEPCQHLRVMRNLVTVSAFRDQGVPGVASGTVDLAVLAFGG